eukprot:scaffold2421_cov390-Prasinococcus_capsulatus_cf.AAC.3
MNAPSLPPDYQGANYDLDRIRSPSTRGARPQGLVGGVGGESVRVRGRGHIRQTEGRTQVQGKARVFGSFAVSPPAAALAWPRVRSRLGAALRRVAQLACGGCLAGGPPRAPHRRLGYKSEPSAPRVDQFALAEGEGRAARLSPRRLGHVQPQDLSAEGHPGAGGGRRHGK